jgi:hypothetical protein
MNKLSRKIAELVRREKKKGVSEQALLTQIEALIERLKQHTET